MPTRIRTTCLVLLTFAPVLPAHAIDIARDGAGVATIVVAPGSSAPVRHAAQELRSFLQQVTGATLPMGGPAAASTPRIFVGPSSAALADPVFSIDGLGTDGLVIRTVGGDLILAGGEPRGTLYAVYTFLEDHVGCRWWAPDATTIPRRPDLRFDALNVRFIPRFECREPYWETALDRDWAVRNKALGGYIRHDAATGGKPPVTAAHHSFDQLIPPRQYFESHPEWFSELDGKRTRQGGQLCLSNEAMREQLTQNVLASLRRAKNPTQISVAQNDGGRPCQCAACRAVDEQEGSPSGMIVRFVNAVAERVEKEFPKVAINTFAYTYSQPAPRLARPRDNVAIWLCTMNCSYNLPLADHKRNESFATALMEWSRICKRLYIWDYTTNFRHYLFIHPNLRVLGPNIRFFAANNVVGVFEQGATGTTGAEFGELRAWVLAKLLWNPELDDHQLIDAFLAGYYGPAGRPIRAYIDTIHDVMQAGRQPLGCYEEPDRKFMDIEVLSKGWAHLKDAERAVADDPVLRQRVRIAQMPVLYAFMIRWDSLRGKAASRHVPWPLPDNPREVLAEFKSRAASIGVQRVSELETFDRLEAKLKLP